jgi:hypothetical protein
MARTPALTNGPVEFTDSKGNQVSLPLSSIFFDGNTIHAEGPLYTANQAAADDWLTYLAKIGEIVPDANPPSKTAMVIQAKAAGSTGNLIQVQFSNLDDTDPNDVKFDAAVTETDTYTQLTPGTVQAALAAQPGLVSVPGSPATELPKPGAYALAVSAPNTPASVDIPKNSGAGNAFTVQARTDAADGALTQVTIKDVTATTFTLVAAWKKTATQITAANVGATFDYEITVSAPTGGALSAPAAGTVTLSGGSDAAPANEASAVVPG